MYSYQEYAIAWELFSEVYHSISQYITVYYSIPQYTTVNYSVLQYTTVYHSIPQYRGIPFPSGRPPVYNIATNANDFTAQKNVSFQSILVPQT